MSIPAEDCVGRDDASHLLEHLPTQGLTLHREAAPLVVIQTESSTTELLSKNAVLLLQVVDDRELATVYPAGEQQEKEVERVRWGA